MGERKHILSYLRLKNQTPDMGKKSSAKIIEKNELRRSIGWQDSVKLLRSAEIEEFYNLLKAISLQTPTALKERLERTIRKCSLWCRSGKRKQQLIPK